MGYWNTNQQGSSLLTEDTGMYWGDAPADIMSAAIDKIRKTFREDVGREPTIGEIRAGMEFALMRFEDQDSAEVLDQM